MVVKIHGFNHESREYAAAESLKKMFELDLDLLKEENEIHLILNVNCPSNVKRDVDILIIGNLKNYSRELVCSIFNGDKKNESRQVTINNFCVTIETKSHDIQGIKFSNEDLAVGYPGEYRCVREQSEGQKYALKNILDSKNLSCWVSNLIFLPKVDIQNKEDYNISNLLLGRDSTLTDFFTKLLKQKTPVLKNNSYIYSIFFQERKNTLKEIINYFTKTSNPTPLDRKKIEAICTKIVDLDKQKYREKMGKQLLVFKGRGGSGKTFRLLNLAHTMYDEESARCLILTFNHALVSDIQRLFSLMKLHSGLEESIQILPLFHFWGMIFYRAGIRDENSNDDITNQITFKKYKEIFIEKLKLKKISLEDLREKYPSYFNWDYIFIDEGQDWSEDEKELIFEIFSFRKVTVADGVDQLVRSQKRIEWTSMSTLNEKQVVPLRKSLRQKPNLLHFIKEINKSLEVNEWNIESDDRFNGGKIKIIEGAYSPEIHAKLVEENAVAGNKNIDMLFCVDPPLAKISEEGGNSPIVYFFENIKEDYWDGTKLSNRVNFPKDENQFRLLQYESTRGLEGWSVVNLNFDLFFDYKKDTYKDEEVIQKTLESIQERAKDYASHWLLIPLTRAIDTLVLQISSRETFIGKMLLQIYNKSRGEDNPLNITWINSKDILPSEKIKEPEKVKEIIADKPISAYQFCESCGCILVRRGNNRRCSRCVNKIII